MSNTVINWRFGAYHLQVIRWGDWRCYMREGRSPITWRRNGYHAKPLRPANWQRVQLYQGRGYLALPVAMLAAAIWAVI